ncbi:MAG: exosome complex RNA-binding protein Rrp4 [Candidatus Woesearchaeota archaeon]
MSEIYVKNRDVAVPGDILAKGMDYLPGFGTYRKKDLIIGSRLGLIKVDGRAIKLTPLTGRYIPKKNDVVIGKVIDITMSGWRLNINSAYSGMLMMKDATSEFIQKGADLTKFFDLGEYMVCKIVNVTSQKLVDLTMKGPGLKKLNSGRIITVNPYKVPRIIGKQGSMVSMIKDATGCYIVVGQNGLIWLKGEAKNETIAIMCIKMIEQEAHIPGLTTRIKEFLEKKLNKEININKGE